MKRVKTGLLIFFSVALVGCGQPRYMAVYQVTPSPIKPNDKKYIAIFPFYSAEVKEVKQSRLNEQGDAMTEADFLEIDCFDLNDDGIEEILAIFYPDICIEHLCQVYLLQKNKHDEWKIIWDDMAFLSGIYVMDTSHNGYRDLVVYHTGDSGIMRPHKLLYQWNGTSYQDIERGQYSFKQDI